MKKEEMIKKLNQLPNFADYENKKEELYLKLSIRKAIRESIYSDFLEKLKRKKLFPLDIK